jgi:hypothetical protein
MTELFEYFQTAPFFIMKNRVKKIVKYVSNCIKNTNGFFHIDKFLLLQWEKKKSKQRRMNMRIMATIFSIMLFLTFGQASHASTMGGTDSAIKEIVKKSLDAQVKLSEKERDLKEIHEMLIPYFTSSFMQKFLKENLVKTNYGYQTFGTDFARYYIPFFSYDQYTKVVHYNNKYYVLEKRNLGNEGPVLYTSEYQGVCLVNEDGRWKVENVLYDLPIELLKKMNESDKTGFNKNTVALLAENPFFLGWKHLFNSSFHPII